MTLQRAKASVDRLLEGLLVVIFGVLVVDVLWQVFTRYVMQDPSSFTGELARYLLIWLGLMGASYAFGKRAHLAIDLFVNSRSRRGKQIVQLIIEVCVLLFALLVMVAGGLQLVSITFSLGQTSAALGLPLGYVYLSLPLSGILIIFYAAVYITERLRELRGHPSSVMEADRPRSKGMGEETDVRSS